MVDGVGNSNSQQNLLKLKGKDGQTIDLNKLKGLQKTKQNEVLFKMYDKDGDGKINEKEAIAMQKNLYSLSNGDGKISKREMKSLYGDNNKAAFEALSKLADQQAALEKGSDYQEVSGNTTTHVYKGSTDEHSYTYTEMKNPDGSTLYAFSDGTVETHYKDGTKAVISKDGTSKIYDKDDNLVKVTKNDGSTIEHSADGNKTVTKNPEGQTTSSLELRGDNTVRTEYEYSNGQKIAREYTGEGDAAKLTLITVSTKKDGHNIDIKYASEEDMKNNRPSETIQDAQNPTLKTATKYTYDEAGNVKAETTNSAGEKTIKYTNANGEEIEADQFNKPKDESYSYTVPKGHSITQIVTDNLKQQGIENPTKEQIKQASEQLLETNQDQVHTMKAGKYKGNKYFYADAQITVPKFNLTNTDTSTIGDESAIRDNVLPEVVTATTPSTPSEEMIQKRKTLQAQLGNDFEVGYSNDGTSLEVRDKKTGEILPEVTKKANASSDNETLTEEIIQAGDGDNNQSLDKTEFRSFIINTLGLELTDVNRNQIESLIDSSFSSLDSIQQDGTISKEELNKNASKILEQIGNAIDDMESQQAAPQSHLGVDNPDETKQNSAMFDDLDPNNGTYIS